MRIPSTAALAASLFAAGCVATPPPNLLPAFNPADPVMGIRDARYSPVLGGFHPRRPTGPQDWRRLNDSLSPANRESGS
ncbi:MAG: hypothetical protein F9K19_02205 [Rhizobiaceae bacterium]|nr:MAG: hypothetical protein F9K19_02205 [Rhizobiaceae bacterium]